MPLAADSADRWTGIHVEAKERVVVERCGREMGMRRQGRGDSDLRFFSSSIADGGRAEVQSGARAFHCHDGVGSAGDIQPIWARVSNLADGFSLYGRRCRIRLKVSAYMCEGLESD